MAEAKTKCNECGAEILVATAERTGGSCMPCHQKANPITFEITPEDEERFRAINAIVARLVDGCSEEEFSSLRCPVCTGPLALSVHPRLRAFSVRCSSSTLHFCRHEAIATAPAWWHSYVTGGWYERPWDVG